MHAHAHHTVALCVRLIDTLMFGIDLCGHHPFVCFLDINYHLTQFLSRHGGCRKYPHRFDHDTTAWHSARIFQTKRKTQNMPSSIAAASGKCPPSLPDRIRPSEDSWMETCSFTTQAQRKLRRKTEANEV